MYLTEPLKNPPRVVNISAQLFLKVCLLLQEFLNSKCCFLTMLLYKHLQSIHASSLASGNNVYMCVCVFREYKDCAVLAQMLQEKLDGYKADDPTMGEVWQQS